MCSFVLLLLLSGQFPVLSSARSEIRLRTECCRVPKGQMLAAKGVEEAVGKLSTLSLSTSKLMAEAACLLKLEKFREAEASAADPNKILLAEPCSKL